MKAFFSLCFSLSSTTDPATMGCLLIRDWVEGIQNHPVCTGYADAGKSMMRWWIQKDRMVVQKVANASSTFLNVASKQHKAANLRRTV